MKVRVTDEEHARMREYAKSQWNGSVSSMLRDVGCAHGDGETSQRTRFIEVHDVDAAEVSEQIKLMRIELAAQGRNLNQVARSTNAAANDGMLGRNEAAICLDQVKTCEAYLEAVEWALSEIQPLEHHVMMRFRDEDVRRHANSPHAEKEIDSVISEGGE